MSESPLYGPFTSKGNEIFLTRVMKIVVVPISLLFLLLFYAVNRLGFLCVFETIKLRFIFDMPIAVMVLLALKGQVTSSVGNVYCTY